MLATSGPEGLDCSPRGDPTGFVRVVDEKTLSSPTAAATTASTACATSSRDPRISLLFLIPGVGETMRVNGRADDLDRSGAVQSFAMNGKVPRCVLVVHVESVYFQCAKAIVRSKLWDPATKVDRKSLPTAGKILAEISDGKIGGESTTAWRRRASRRRSTEPRAQLSASRRQLAS